MSEQKDTKKPERNLIISRLAQKYGEDFEASIAEFPADKKVEFIEHLLECLELIEAYMLNPTNENWKFFADKENAFLKKHGKRLKIYNAKKMTAYYDYNFVLCEKKIYTTEEWNALEGEEQKLSAKEFSGFAWLCKNLLYNQRHDLLLEQVPVDEIEKATKETLSGASENQLKKRNVIREAEDKMTSLNLNQTVLLIHHLQQEKVLLKGEFLNNTEAGKAFEILTGYSANTIRQTLGKPELYRTKTNLKEIENILTRLKISIGNALKEK